METTRKTSTRGPLVAGIGRALGLTLALAAPGAAHARTLTGDEVRTLISGNTLQGSYFAKQLTIAFYPDGKLVGTLGLSGSDVGTWTMKEDLYCQHWVRYFGAEERCYRWAQNGARYDLENADAYRTHGFGGRIDQGFPPGF